MKRSEMSIGRRVALRLHEPPVSAAPGGAVLRDALAQALLRTRPKYEALSDWRCDQVY